MTEIVVKNGRPFESRGVLQSFAPVSVSLLIMGAYCIVMELDIILEKGLFYGFNAPACISIFVSAIGGLIVAAVLKFADAGELMVAVWRVGGAFRLLQSHHYPNIGQFSKDMQQQ